MLRNNQLDAINASKNNNFKSGIHFHATGTGKSWIALNIILEYNKNKKNNLIFWITEKKSILIEQFSKLKIIENGYESIYDDFLIQDYSQKKNLKQVQKVARDALRSVARRSLLDVISN